MDTILQAIARKLRNMIGFDQKPQQLVDNLLNDIEVSDNKALSEQIELVQKAYRLLKILETGAYKDGDLLKALKNSGDKLWTKEEAALKANRRNVKRLAKRLFLSSNPTKNEKLILSVSPRVQEISEELIRICQENGVDFDLNFEEPRYLAVLLNHLDEEEIKKMAALHVDRLKGTNKIIGVRTSLPQNDQDVDKESYDLWKEYLMPFQRKIRSGRVYFTNTRIPTPEDAKADKIDYLDYKKLYFQACDQPWKAIKRAQNFLIKKFDKATVLRITNSDGTDITLNISGRSFCNSVVGKNIPGSEIFSAPNLDGVNGVIVSKERHRYKGSGVMEDLVLEFKDGKCVFYTAKKGIASLKRILETDDGAKFVGEIGIGTNPHLRRCFTNIALAEKVSGSFHIALGACYTFDVYEDQTVNVDNGNRSQIHWDITTMLRGKKGVMRLDGDVIQKDGLWLFEQCKVLNLGWEALPEEERRDWWKKEFPNGYED